MIHPSRILIMAKSLFGASWWRCFKFYDWNTSPISPIRRIHFLKSSIKRPRKLNTSKYIQNCNAKRSLNLATLCVIPAMVSMSGGDNVNTPNRTIEVPDPSTLTHRYLLRQAAVVALDSALTILLQAVIATLDAQAEHQKAIERLIEVTENSLNALGNEFLQDAIWESIIAARSDMEERQRVVDECKALMSSVVKLVNASAETAFTVGCEFASLTAAERLYSADQQLTVSDRLTKSLQDSYLEQSKKCVEKTSEYEKTRKTKLESTSEE